MISRNGSDEMEVTVATRGHMSRVFFIPPTARIAYYYRRTIRAGEYLRYYVELHSLDVAYALT